MTLPDDQTSEQHERLLVWGYYTEANNDVSVGKALGNLGNGYQIAERYELARACLDERLVIARRNLNLRCSYIRTLDSGFCPLAG